MSQADHEVDLAVIGGGVNGCGVARDAAGRGLSVYLCEAGDLAQGTSSASTKLIHGGLRYLEHRAFRLVREALIERGRLLRNAPHIVWPMRFVLPHHEGLRPRWLLRLGLLLYDSLGGRGGLPATRGLHLAALDVGKPLRERFRRGFSYYDCWVDDARLVVLNAVDAAERGAVVRTRARCVSAKRGEERWLLHVEREGGSTETVRAHALVNAAGPWVGAVGADVLRHPVPAPLRLVKGSHILTRPLFAHDSAYIFQNADGRIVFAIPYENNRFTLIGTTDRDYRGDPAQARAEEDEIAYLCDAVSAYFREPIGPQDVVGTYSGVRPLYDDGASSAQEATRDYVLALDREGGAPLVEIYGGKITTYRKLAEAVLARLGKDLQMRAPWTGDAPLPGGEFPFKDFEARVARLAADYPFLAPDTTRRLMRSYGERCRIFLDGATDLGRIFTVDLGERELRYLVEHEFARSAEDVLARRTKLGLFASPQEREAIEAFLAERLEISGS